MASPWENDPADKPASAGGAPWERDPEYGPRIGPVAAAVTGASQGATFGFMDELAGAGLALGAKAMGAKQSLGELYDIGVSVPRMAQKAAAEQHPIPYYGGQIAAGVAPGIASGGASALPNVARAGLGVRSMAGAGEGMVAGGLFGAGTAEGGLGDRAGGAATGAAFGGLAGGVLPGAVDAVSAVGRSVAAPIRGMLAPNKFGYEKYAEAVMRDVNPTGNAVRSARDVSNKVSYLRASTGKDVRNVDLGGENTRNLVKTATAMPNTGAQKFNSLLNKRQAEQWRRIEGDLSKAVGSPDEYAATLDDIVSKRSAQATPDFDTAMAVDVPFTPKLSEVLNRPAIQRLIGEVSENMANEGASFNGLPPMQALHRVKLELDEALTRARKARDMGQSPTAGMDMRTLTILKKDLVGAIDNPAYRTALDNFAGASALKNALEDGRDNFFKMDTEEIGSTLASMTASERDMWRLGAARAIAGKNRKGNVTFDRTDRDFSSPDMAKRMEALFPDQASRREFQKRLVIESKMADTRKAVQGNSSTFKQQVQGQEAGQPVAVVNAVANAAGGRFEPALSMLARTGNRLTGITPQSANAILEAAMSRGGDEAAVAVENALMRANQVPIQRNALSRGLTGAANAARAGYFDSER